MKLTSPEKGPEAAIKQLIILNTYQWIKSNSFGV